MRCGGSLLSFVSALFLVFSGITPAWADEAAPLVTPDAAYELLKEGNSRHVAGSPTHPNLSREHRTATAAEAEHPFAVILGCSDARAPVELLFDQGVGDLFIVRVAGNVADIDEIGSIEFGVEYLAIPLVVVLGHTHCDAVTAVVEGKQLHGYMPALVDNIAPAVAKAKAAHPEASGDALVEATIPTNVRQSIEDILKSSEIIRSRVKSGALKIVGGVYDIESGRITWLGSHPEEAGLLKKYGGKNR